MSDNKQTLSLDTWQVQQLRFTFFPAEPLASFKNEWWTELLEMPENQIVSPREARQVDSGRFGNGFLELSVTPVRIDWNYAAIIDVSDEDSLVSASLGNFEIAPKVFIKLCQSWLNAIPDIASKRIAFGGVVIQPAKASDIAYRMLANYLPFSPPTEHASDFVYQINRWRLLKIAENEIRINRLTKWSAGKLVQSIATPNVDPVTLNESVFARLEFDMNTDGEWNGTFSAPITSQILGQLVTLAKEVALQGDIP